MKRMSIKLRITLWYSALMLVLVALMIGFMLGIGGTVARQDARSLLMQVVDENLRHIDGMGAGRGLPDEEFSAFRGGVYTGIYSPEGELLQGQAPEGLESGPPFAEGRVQQLRGEENYLVYDRAYGRGRRPQGWVRGYIPENGAVEFAGVLTRTALFTLPLAVLLAALGGYLITKRAFRPIQQINEATRAISGGDDLSRRIELGEGQDEVHQLAGTINGMLQRLQDSFEDEKRFVADASHELRTPTSVILAQCEYAEGRESSPGEMGETLAVIRRQAGKMSRLISQLLALSRMDAAPSLGEAELTDLGEWFSLLAEDLRAATDSDITLHTRFAGGVQARVDRLMMARLFENLVQNAYQYGRKGGNIYVGLSCEIGMVSLQVEDDGIGIAPEELPKIWRRFYRADSSRSGGGHAGLGLAMVGQIARLHGGTATAQSRPGQGSVFLVQFPQNL